MNSHYSGMMRMSSPTVVYVQKMLKLDVLGVTEIFIARNVSGKHIHVPGNIKGTGYT